MKNTNMRITADDLLEIFSKVTHQFQKRAKTAGEGKSMKISKEELLEMFKEASEEIASELPNKTKKSGGGNGQR